MKRIYKTKFDASHKIEGHSKCGQRHNHEYQLKVTLDSSDEWVDFHTIRECVEKALENIGIKDHTENWLGHMTCEKLAQKIRLTVIKEFKISSPDEVFVELYETEHFGVLYP